MVAALALGCAEAEAPPDFGGSPSDAGSAGQAGNAGAGGAAGSPVTAGGAPIGGATTAGGSAGTGASAGAGGGGLAGGGSAGNGGSGGTATAGVGGASGVLFSDDFETSNADGWFPSVSADWSVVTDGSMVYKQSTLIDELRVNATGDSHWTDLSIELKVKPLSFGANSSADQIGIYARYWDLSNWYALTLRGDGRIALRRRVNGSNNQVGDSANAMIAAGTWYTIKFEVIGATLNAYVDGVLLVTATDASLATGGIGLGGLNYTAEFDDVVVKIP